MTKARSFFRDHGIAWLLAVCLVVQAGITSFYGPVQAKTTFSNDGTFWTVVICTGNGQREITLDADGNLVDDVQKSTMDMSCPLCVASHVDYALSAVQKIPQQSARFNDHAQSVYTLNVTDLRPDDLHCLDPPHIA